MELLNILVLVIVVCVLQIAFLFWKCGSLLSQLNESHKRLDECLDGSAIEKSRRKLTEISCKFNNLTRENIEFQEENMQYRTQILDLEESSREYEEELRDAQATIAELKASLEHSDQCFRSAQIELAKSIQINCNLSADLEACKINLQNRM